MQTGTIDGLENPLPDAMASKFYEVSKQVVLTGHMVANIFFTLAEAVLGRPLGRREEAPSMAAEAAAKKLNDEGVAATEATPRPSSRARASRSPRRTSPPSASRCRTTFLELRLRQELAGRHAGPDQRRPAPEPASHAGGSGCMQARWSSVWTRWGRAGGGSDVRGDVRRLHDPDRQPLCASTRRSSWSLELCSIAYVWVVFWSCDICWYGSASTSSSTCSIRSFRRASRRVAGHRQHRGARARVSRGPSGHARLHPFLGAAPYDDAACAAWTSSIPASAFS